ncbi:MAG: S8 family serine peptidase [Thermoleophilia bacterium]
MTPAQQPPPPAPPVLDRPGPATPARAADALDPLTGRQGFLPRINWTPPAPGGRRPVVAVLDTGVDPSHPDLAGVVMTGAGRSFVPSSPDPTVDPEGHGTHVAGIIAATSGNGVGGSGIANARILPVTIADAQGRTTTTALVRGLRYASARGARVINISFGGRGFSRLEQEAIDLATRRGALVVAAVGNSGGQGGGPGYPGAYRQVLAVAALSADGRALGISERGAQVALAAPGSAIASTGPRRRGGAPPAGLTQRTGTSMAAAVVTGVAARVIAQRPGLGAQQVRALLEETAQDVPPSGLDTATGAGSVDLAAALAARPPAPADPEPNDDFGLALATKPLLRATGPSSAARSGRTGSWADPRDIHRVALREGDRVTITLAPSGEATGDLDLALWRPGTPAGARGAAAARSWLVAASLGPQAQERITAVATTTGVHLVEVRGVRGGESGSGRGAIAYTLTVNRGVTAAERDYPAAPDTDRMGRR